MAMANSTHRKTLATKPEKGFAGTLVAMVGPTIRHRHGGLDHVVVQSEDFNIEGTK
jgi:hypothetical protein